MEKFARALVGESAVIKKVEEKGYYIANSVWHLYSDGIVRKGTLQETGKVSAYWPTSQQAHEFYKDWKKEQGINPKPKECGCADLRQRIAELEAERDEQQRWLDSIFEAWQHVCNQKEEFDGGFEDHKVFYDVGHLRFAALTQGEEK